MKSNILFTLILFFFCTPATWATVTIESFQISLEKMYTNDDRTILFTAKVNSSAENLPHHLVLFQTDETGKKIKYRWKLTDNGFLGDEKKGDGIYSRKVEYKKSKAGKVDFFVSLNADIPSQDLKVSIEIIRRPSFLELLGEIWNRLK